jgi:hypothetical protein
MAYGTVIANPGSGGASFAVDDVGGVKFPRGKITFGVEGAALDVSSTNPLPVLIGDGTRQATVRDTGSSDSLNVAIVDASGNQITSFGGGGGAQYTEGDTDATITGTALLWEDAGDTLRAVSSAKPLPVLLSAGTSNIGDVDVLSVPAPLSTTGGGTEATALRVTIATDSTGVLSIDDNGASITVDGAVSITGTVTVDTELGAAAALTDNFANPTAPSVGAFGMLWDGTAWDRAPGTSADGLLVNLGTNNDITVTGTVTVDSELPAAAALTDTMANPTAPAVGAFSMVWDGTDWARQIEAVTGLNTTGTGLSVHAIAAQFDDTSTTSVTENRFAHLRIDDLRQLRVRADASNFANDLVTAGIPLRVRYKGGTSLSTGQVSAGTTESQVVAASSVREAVLIVNHGSVDVYLGATGIDSSTGLLLPGVKGASVTLPTQTAVYCRTASGNQTISFAELA